jgi:hypothetical protein
MQEILGNTESNNRWGMLIQNIESEVCTSEGALLPTLEFPSFAV